MGRLERLIWKGLLITGAIAAGVAVAGVLEAVFPVSGSLPETCGRLLSLFLWMLWLSASTERRDLLLYRLGWGVRALVPLFARAWNPLVSRILLRDKTPVSIHDFRVYSVTFDEPQWDVKVLLQRLGEELETLRSVKPSRFERLRRIDPRIVIMPIATGSYAPGANVITLDPGLLTEWAPGYAATVLVHESNHARLHELGILFGHPWLISRAEWRAIKDQWLFAFRLADAGYEDAVHQFVAWFKEVQDKPWWEGAGKRRARRAMLERVGVPRWMWPLLGGRRAATSHESPTPALS